MHDCFSIYHQVTIALQMYQRRPQQRGDMTAAHNNKKRDKKALAMKKPIKTRFSAVGLVFVATWLLLILPNINWCGTA